jgi:ATP-binding protein involved in chromosome partitioning
MIDAIHPQPLEVGRANEHDVRIAWADGHESVYRAADLRLACPCAACAKSAAALTPGRIRVVPAGIQTVRPLRIELVGRYGIRIHWSDGHAHGIYRFEWLRAACPCCAPNVRGS